MIDWPLIVNRLRKAHGNLEIVAGLVHSCPQHLRRLSRGDINDTKFLIGIRLLDLHADGYPEQHREIEL